MSFFNKYKWLIPSLTFSIVLIILRVAYTGYSTFAWMIWNLFLAIVPLYVSHHATRVEKRMNRWLLGIVWLLFFPNSIYMVTDLFHLSAREPVPMWYDLLLLFSTAVNGVIVGLISLNNMEQAMSTMLKKRLLHLSTFGILFLCGYGIYLGRYERWNSWDIVTQPFSLLSSVGYHIIHPFRNIEVWAISLFFGVWLYLLYQYINRFKQYVQNK